MPDTPTDPTRPGSIKRLLMYLRPVIGLAAGACLLSIAFALFAQAAPFLQRMIIDRFLLPREASDVLSRQARLDGLLAFAGIYAAVALAEFATRFWLQYLVAYLGQRILMRIRLDVFAKLQRLPLAYYNRNPVGQLLTRVTSDLDAIQMFLSNGIVTIMQSIFVLCAAFAFMLMLSWQLTLLASVAVPLLFRVTRFFQRRLRDAFRDIGVEQTSLASRLNENITGMLTLQLFNRVPRSRHEFAEASARLRDSDIHAVRIFSWYMPLVQLTSSVAIAALIWYGGGQALSSVITVGTLFAFTQYVKSFFQPLSDLSEAMNTLQSAMASADRVFKVLDEPVAIADPPLPSLPMAFRGEVELKDVWFSYADGPPTEADWVLRGINLRIKAGESVALVGATGAGKSSAIGLISRFYDVQRGSVLVDGIDVRSYRQRELRRRVCVVLQDVFLFSGTIASNLRLGDESISMSKVEEACRYVGAHDFITALPEGYQTVVMERGATLSTGQKQLLAFARAWLHYGESVLILDEATANVDTHAEQRILAAQSKLTRNRTSIIIAHRLSTIRGCDRIVVLKRGEIVEEGTHDELVKRNGYYAALCRYEYAASEALIPAAHASPAAYVELDGVAS